MARSGTGLDGFKHTSFQEYIVREVCRYYFELDPVLRDRPNVRAWFTNEDETKYSNNSGSDMQHHITLLSSDEESMTPTSPQYQTRRGVSTTSNEDFESSSSTSESEINVSTNIDTCQKEKSNTDDEYENVSDHSHTTSFTNNHSSTLSSTSDDNNSLTSRSPVSNKSRQRRRREINKKNRRTKARSIKRNRFFLNEAKTMETDINKKKKKSIVNKNGMNKFNTMLSMDDDDRDMLKETQDNKLLFETKKYNKMKKLEEKRIMLEEKRLGMEEHSIHLKNESLVINNNL